MTWQALPNKIAYRWACKTCGLIVYGSDPDKVSHRMTAHDAAAHGTAGWGT